MRIFLNGVEIAADPKCNRLHVEVDPQGETVAPFHFDVVGGPLTLWGNEDNPTAMVLDWSGLKRPTGFTGYLLSFFGFSLGPPIHKIGFDGEEQRERPSWRDKPPMI